MLSDSKTGSGGHGRGICERSKREHTHSKRKDGDYQKVVSLISSGGLGHHRNPLRKSFIRKRVWCGRGCRSQRGGKDLVQEKDSSNGSRPACERDSSEGVPAQKKRVVSKHMCGREDGRVGCVWFRIYYVAMSTLQNLTGAASVSSQPYTGARLTCRREVRTLCMDPLHGSLKYEKDLNCRKWENHSGVMNHCNFVLYLRHYRHLCIYT